MSNVLQEKRHAYIVGRWYDSIFIIFSPLLCLLIGYLISDTWLTKDVYFIYNQQASFANLFIGVVIMSHLFLVFFRSHLNTQIFSRFPYRFTIVPILLFLALISNYWILVFVSILAVWWDVYHSGLQTFGLGRIYDMKVGNQAGTGRHLDIILNHFLYMGPILGGVTLMDHVDDIYLYQKAKGSFLFSVPPFIEAHSLWLTIAVLLVGLPFCIYYLYAYTNYIRQGYQVSWQKAALYLVTAVVSIWMWAFNSFGEAFFIMNFFHAIQYYAIVWAMEKKQLQKTFRLSHFKWGSILAIIPFLGIPIAYGFWTQFTGQGIGISTSLFLVVSIMHFWYDGFIWSVRKKHVA